MGNDECETDSVPVRDPDGVLGRQVEPGDVADGGDDGESDGGHAGRESDGELGRRHGDRNRLPGVDGGQTERTDLDRRVVDARVGLGEDEEEGRSEGETG